MSTLGSPYIGCYNEKEDDCVYANAELGCYCAIGAIIKEIKPRFADKEGSTDSVRLGSYTLSAMGDTSKYNVKAAKLLSDSTGLTIPELKKLQVLHDSSIKKYGSKYGLKRQLNAQAKYEEYVASL